MLRVLYAVVFGLVLVPVPSIGQDRSADCNPSINIDIDETSFTREEVIALIDELFYESLAEYQECLGGGASGGAVASGATSGGQTSGSIESVAASGVQGTDSPSLEPIEEESVSTFQSDLPPADNGKIPEDLPLADNGKIPEDIPPADNDSVLAAQIRLAAENETDPAAQAALWNEYRKVKGIKVREVK